MEKKKRTIRWEKKLPVYLRAAVQLLFFILFPSAFTAAFAGVKDLFTRIGAGDAVEWTSFTVILAALLAYTAVFGRFFCGYACAFGSLGDAIRGAYTAICKKLKRKPLKLKKSWEKPLVWVKYAVLFLIVLLCFGKKYGSTAGTSPWDVFSMLRAGNFHPGGYGIGVVLFLLILAGMAVCERFFCRFLCPMGAVFALLPVFPPFSMRRNTEKCIKGCAACHKVCPTDCTLPEHDSWEVNGECIQCGKCRNHCPKKNAGITGIHQSAAETGFTILRAAALLVLFWWAGV